MRLATNLLLICTITIFLFGACAGLGIGAKAVTSNGNHTEINLFSHNFNNNNVMSRNSRTDTRTTRVDADNTLGALGLAACVVVGMLVWGRMKGEGY